MNRLAKLRDFSRRRASDLKASLNNAAVELALRPLSGTVAIAVSGGKTQRLLLANLSRPEVDEIPEGECLAESADFMLYVEETVLMDILRGELSPLSAFLRGRLRYAGDVKLGVAIFRELASTHDAVFEPCRHQRAR